VAGPGRKQAAGWYSYDLLDNLGRSSARRIIPELQHLAPGDIVPMSPQGIQVYSLDRPNSMIWGTPGEVVGSQLVVIVERAAWLYGDERVVPVAFGGDVQAMHVQVGHLGQPVDQLHP